MREEGGRGICPVHPSSLILHPFRRDVFREQDAELLGRGAIVAPDERGELHIGRVEQLAARFLGGPRQPLGRLGLGQARLDLHLLRCDLGEGAGRLLLRLLGPGRVPVGRLLVLPGHGRQPDGPLVGEQRQRARDAREHRDGGEARDHQAELARRALLLVQAQLLGLGQLPGLLELPPTRRFSRLLLGLHRRVAGLQEGDGRLEFAAVLVGPLGIGRLLLAPGERDLQVGVAEQPGLAVAPEPGRVQQPPEDPRRLRLVFHPHPQPLPAAHQALVRQVDHRPVDQLHLGAGHHERDAVAAKGIQHRRHRVAIRLGDRPELGQPRRPTNPSVVVPFLGERLEDLLAGGPMAVVGQRVMRSRRHGWRAPRRVRRSPRSRRSRSADRGRRPTTRRPTSA